MVVFFSLVWLLTLIIFFVLIFKKRSVKKKFGVSSVEYNKVSKIKRIIGVICIIAFIGGIVTTPPVEKKKEASEHEVKTEQSTSGKQEEPKLEIITKVGELHDGQLAVDVETNIVDGAELIVTVSSQQAWLEANNIPEDAQLNDEQLKRFLAETYSGQNKLSVKNGKIHAEYTNVKPGNYEVTVSMSYVNLLPQAVKEAYGENGEKMPDGPCVVVDKAGKSISHTDKVALK